MQIFAGVRWRWGVKWEWGHWKWRFSLYSFTVFRTFYIHGHATAFRWYDWQWPWAYFKVIGLFHMKFLKYGVWYGKSFYRLLIGNHTLAFDWCHFWWPWSTFEGHFSLGCHFHVYFSNLWHAFASHSLPAIAELLVSDILGYGVWAFGQCTRWPRKPPCSCHNYWPFFLNSFTKYAKAKFAIKCCVVLNKRFDLIDSFAVLFLRNIRKLTVFHIVL